MFDLSIAHIVLVVLCAVFIGVSKTGIPTLNILVVAVMASIFPARESIGIVLPMLIIGDIVAVTYYRRSVDWKTLLSLLPWVLGGLLAGFVLLYFIVTSRPIEILLGVIILFMVSIQISRERWGINKLQAVPKTRWFVALMGTLAGFTTMIGNAAGPIMALFLLAISLSKKEFIGTGAWFYLAVNLIKVPMYAGLGLITWETLSFNAWLIPAILGGTALGIKVLPFIPQKIFNIVVLLLSLVGGMQLVIP
ncbi:hypothetical protein SAMN05192534_101382 [Alteribacillus persepolensis]|uniref:Probable membrane transporter protein n=1 Tax=Alteribacillus persepolensis TaxID=568899 RepID=A0A1G7Z3A6_9BACI|nr:sulfite exporter TauE/SafE family protein [Alteribacillus persepolensis]SDH03107.1 hypothetical protein SAMN05192534_101382 [Alteribacillus persepolensis]